MKFLNATGRTEEPYKSSCFWEKKKQKLLQISGKLGDKVLFIYRVYFFNNGNLIYYRSELV